MFPSTYFAGGFFPATYFPETPGSPDTVIPLPGYFARGYFAGVHFAPGYFPNGQGQPPQDNFSYCFTAIKDQLVASGLITDRQVVISLLDEPFPSGGFPQLVIVPGEFEPIRGQHDGGGRYTAGLDGTFTVWVWVRNASDQAYQHLHVLTSQASQASPVSGAFRLVNLVLGQLIEFFPYHPVSGQLLTQAGCKLIDGPGKPQAWKETGERKGIVGIPITFGLSLRLSLVGSL